MFDETFSEFLGSGKLFLFQLKYSVRFVLFQEPWIGLMLVEEHAVLFFLEFSYITIVSLLKLIFILTPFSLVSISTAALLQRFELLVI